MIEDQLMWTMVDPDGLRAGKMYRVKAGCWCSTRVSWALVMEVELRDGVEIVDRFLYAYAYAREVDCEYVGSDHSSCRL